MYEIFFDVSLSNQNPGATSVYSTVILYIYQLSLVPPPNFYTWRTPWLQCTTKYNMYKKYAYKIIKFVRE